MNTTIFIWMLILQVWQARNKLMSCIFFFANCVRGCQLLKAKLKKLSIIFNRTHKLEIDNVGENQ